MEHSTKDILGIDILDNWTLNTPLSCFHNLYAFLQQINSELLSTALGTNQKIMYSEHVVFFPDKS